MKNNEIVPYAHPAKSFSYDIPEAEQNQYKGTVTAIKNAWENSTSLDNTGQLWIDTDNLHTILRTSKGNARYIAASISEDSKISYKKKVFVRGYEIIKLLDKLIQESGPSTKNDYLRYSEKYYAALRDSDKGKLLRANAEKALLEAKKTLKKRRIKTYKIKFDELTGLALDTKNSDFSHIRSFSLFPGLADNINNGLIVNKNTHKIITEKNINDEEELYDLCIEMNWQTSWYDEFKENFIA